MTYTVEMRKFLEEYIPGHHHSETAEEFGKRFGLKIESKAVSSYAKNHKVKTGFSGRFEKGHVPQNKGTKCESRGRMAETQFKKGHTPHNALPVGTEVKRSDGFIQVKIAEPNIWKLKQRITWESVNGPVPKTHLLIFMDGNKENCSIDNLKLVPRNIHSIMNNKKLRSESAELTETGILVAQLLSELAKRRNKNE